MLIGKLQAKKQNSETRWDSEMPKTGLCCSQLSEPVTAPGESPGFKVSEKLPLNHVLLGHIKNPPPLVGLTLT